MRDLAATYVFDQELAAMTNDILMTFPVLDPPDPPKLDPPPPPKPFGW